MWLSGEAELCLMWNVSEIFFLDGPYEDWSCGLSSTEDKWATRVGNDGSEVMEKQSLSQTVCHFQPVDLDK